MLLTVFVIGCRKNEETETPKQQKTAAETKTTDQARTESGTPQEETDKARKAYHEAKKAYEEATKMHGEARKAYVEAKEEYVGSLASRYAGTITASKLESAASYKQADKLMKEWNPVGFSRDDVKKILGQQSRETSDELEYFFPIGSAGVGYIFTLKDDVITGVERRLAI